MKGAAKRRRGTGVAMVNFEGGLSEANTEFERIGTEYSRKQEEQKANSSLEFFQPMIKINTESYILAVLMKVYLLFLHRNSLFYGI